MKIISWNVNGLRAVIKKGFNDFVAEQSPDMLCIQETKMQPGQAEIDIDGYKIYMSSAEKKGYSGTIIYTKKTPLNVVYGIDEKYNDEGRVITLEYNDFYLVNVYTPNSKPLLARIEYRKVYEDDLREYLSRLNNKKPVILCGDLNVAHNEIDLKNPASNHKNPGFSDDEREKFTQLLNAGFTDSFRYLYPEKVQYSWWSYRFNARANNAGWRIDYFVVSNNFIDKVEDSIILDDVYGSDHCPVSITLNSEVVAW